jgi:hypothetical protein
VHKHENVGATDFHSMGTHISAIVTELLARSAGLETALKSGAWNTRVGYLRSRDALDAGYRLLATY